MCALCMFCTKKIARHAVIIQDSSKPQEMESSCNKSHPRMFLKLTWGPTSHPIVAGRFQQKSLAASVSPWFCWRAKQMRLFWTTFPAKAREHTYTRFKRTCMHLCWRTVIRVALWGNWTNFQRWKQSGSQAVDAMRIKSRALPALAKYMFFLFGATR